MSDVPTAILVLATIGLLMLLGLWDNYMSFIGWLVEVTT